jgi:hypothetical protein
MTFPSQQVILVTSCVGSARFRNSIAYIHLNPPEERHEAYDDDYCLESLSFDGEYHP